MLRAHHPEAVPPPVGNYVHALEVIAPARLLHISGQIPVARDGSVPADFASQCRLVWAHVGAALGAAGLDWSHLVKVTTYLSDRAYADENGRIRREVLGAHAPALTVIIAGIFDPRWLLEIEAIAAAPLDGEGGRDPVAPPAAPPTVGG